MLQLMLFLLLITPQDKKLDILKVSVEIESAEAINLPSATTEIQASSDKIFLLSQEKNQLYITDRSLKLLKQVDIPPKNGAKRKMMQGLVYIHDKKLVTVCDPFNEDQINFSSGGELISIEKNFVAWISGTAIGNRIYRVPDMRKFDDPFTTVTDLEGIVIAKIDLAEDMSSAARGSGYHPPVFINNKVYFVSINTIAMLEYDPQTRALREIPILLPELAEISESNALKVELGEKSYSQKQLFGTPAKLANNIVVPVWVNKRAIQLALLSTEGKLIKAFHYQQKEDQKVLPFVNIAVLENDTENTVKVFCSCLAPGSGLYVLTLELEK